jgi:hypothetical protein
MKKEKVSPGVSLPDLKDWHAIAVIVSLVTIFFRDILLRNAYLWEDFLYQYYPFRNFAAVSIAQGQLPLWNPYTFSGNPFQADIQSALFYIPNLLLTLFVNGSRLSFYWVEILLIVHFMIAGIGTYYLTREFGLHRVFALFSGLVYTLSGYMITHAIHLPIISQIAWFPIVLLLFRRSLVQKSILYMILGGLVLGHAVLAGFPQLSLYIFFFLFVYFLFEFFSTVWQEGFLKSSPLLLLGVGTIIVAIGFAAIQLLPTMELAPYSQRAEITFEKSLEGALSWGQLFTLLAPKLFGSTDAGGSTYFGPGQYWAYWETCFYIGIPALIASFFSFLHIHRNRYIGFFWVMAVFSALYALGDGFILHKLFFDYVPGFSKFRSIGRITIYFALGGALLSGFGLQAITEAIQSNSKAIRKGVMIIAAGAIIFWVIGQAGLFHPQNQRQYTEQIQTFISREGTKSLILLLLTTAVLYVASIRKIGGVVMMAALIAVQFIDIHLFGFDQNNGSVNPDEYYNRTARVVDVLRRDGEKEYFRINSRLGGAMILDRNQGMIDRIFMMEGYTPLVLQRMSPPASSWDRLCDIMNAKYRVVVDEKQRRIDLTTASTYTPRAYFVYSAQVIPDEKQVKTTMESPEFDPRKTIVFEGDPHFPLPDLPDTTRGTAEITSYELTKISLNVSTPKNGFLMLSEIYYPGWVAYIDGQQVNVYRADWSLRAIPVTAGTHIIQVVYEPQPFRRGMWISLITIATSIVSIVLIKIPRRKHPEGEENT